jgi:uncharacterized membrane protein
MKRFILAFIAAFIFIFFWGWLYNGVLLKDVFAEAESLFRQRDEIMDLFHWIVIGQAGLALAFVMIYASGFAGGGIARVFALESCWKFWQSARAARFTRRNHFRQNFLY